MSPGGTIDSVSPLAQIRVGMILAVPPRHIARIEAELKRRRDKFYIIGRIANSHRGTARVAYEGKLRL